MLAGWVVVRRTSRPGSGFGLLFRDKVPQTRVAALLCSANSGQQHSMHTPHSKAYLDWYKASAGEYCPTCIYQILGPKKKSLGRDNESVFYRYNLWRWQTLCLLLKRRNWIRKGGDSFDAFACLNFSMSWNFVFS